MATGQEASVFQFDIPFGRLGILLPREQRERLHGTCFRGMQVRAAGNFERWPSFDKMMGDPAFVEPLLEVVQDILAGRKRRPIRPFKERFSLPLAEPVGWSSTLPQGMVSSKALVRRPLNHQAEALFLDDPSIPAARTNLVSLAVSFKPGERERLGALMLIDTLYPGPNVGRLVGDMTAATGQVFLDFHHPGGDTLVELEP